MKNIRVLTNAEYKRRTKKDYLKCKKKELANVLFSMFGNYDRLKELYVEKCLEAQYLERQVIKYKKYLKDLDNRNHAKHVMGR